MSEPRESNNLVKGEVISFLPPIQVGYEIYHENLQIEGIQDWQDNVWEFIQGSNQMLEWEQEPSNPQNPFAIKIIGIAEQMFSTKHAMLGYVPGDVAKEVINSGLWPFLQLRLDCIYVASQGHIAIRFQILGPIRKKSRDEQRIENTLKDGGKNTLKARLPTFRSYKDPKSPKSTQNIFKRGFFFILRFSIITLGILFAFVGGKIGTEAWQTHENLLSRVMIYPIILVIIGGLLIWTGIRPSKHKKESVT